MSHFEAHRAQHPERAKLDEIRRELRLQPFAPRNPCPVCGFERVIPVKRSRPEHKGWIMATKCQLCGGLKVRADNVLRTIVEIIKPTPGGFAYEGTDEQRARREAGCLEPVTPLGVRGP